MDNELAEISAFVRNIPPFDNFPDESILSIVKEINHMPNPEKEQLKDLLL
ncbi:MAG: hypothetical protein HRT52_03565 [Colwellia sp.]|nr:hypothetical protein [Colwellia sp.]